MQQKFCLIVLQQRRGDATSAAVGTKTRRKQNMARKRRAKARGHAYPLLLWRSSIREGCFLYLCWRFSAQQPLLFIAEAEEKEESTETGEEEADRVLAAIDPGLVAFSSDKGGVPYYRLHRVVAKAITRKKFIFVSENGDRPFFKGERRMADSGRDGSCAVMDLAGGSNGWVYRLTFA